MGKIGLTGQADLTVMHPGRVNIGAINNTYICLWMIFCNPIYDIVYADQCWFLVTGYWLLVAGYWLLATGGWFLVAGYWSLVAGYWFLATGGWFLVAGRLLLVAGSWLPFSSSQLPEARSQGPVTIP